MFTPVNGTEKGKKKSILIKKMTSAKKRAGKFTALQNELQKANKTLEI